MECLICLVNDREASQMDNVQTADGKQRDVQTTIASADFTHVKGKPTFCSLKC